MATCITLVAIFLSVFHIYKNRITISICPTPYLILREITSLNSHLWNFLSTSG